MARPAPPAARGPKGTRLKFPQARPRVISDRGPQFIAKDFKEFIRLATEVDLHQWLAARSWRPRSKLKNETPSACNILAFSIKFYAIYNK